MNIQPLDGTTFEEFINRLQSACSLVTESVAVINSIVKTADGRQSLNTGTAFCVDERGYFVTALHVVAGQINTFIVAKAASDVRVVAVDAERDLAIVHVPGRCGFKPVAFALSLPIRGEIVSGLGYGNLNGLAVELSAYPVFYCGQCVAGQGPDGLELEGDTLQSALCFAGAPAHQVGYSGGPLINVHGQVVACTIKGDDESSVVVGPSAPDIQAFVKRHVPAA